MIGGDAVVVSVTDPDGKTDTVDPQNPTRPSVRPQNAERPSVVDPPANAKRRSTNQTPSATNIQAPQNPERLSTDPQPNAVRHSEQKSSSRDLVDTLRTAGGDRGEEDDELDDEDELGEPGRVLSATSDTSPAAKPPLIEEKIAVGYKIRPDLENKFRPGVVQILMEKIIRNYLEGQPYDPEETPKLSKQISDEIQQQVVAQKYNRYKLETIFCCATVYGIYYY